MTELRVFRTMQRLFAFVTLGHWFAYSAIALALTWALASWWPVVFVLFSIAFHALVNTYSIQQRIAVLATVTFPPTPVIFVYEFWLALTDRAWDTLGLTPEERAKVDASPTRPGGFTMERWSTHTRWRVRKSEEGRERETTFDVYKTQSFQEVILWDVSLGDVSLGDVSLEPESGRARITLEWRHRALTLCAVGGRFRGSVDPLGDIFREPEHVLLEIPLPTDPPTCSATEGFDSHMRAYRLRRSAAVGHHELALGRGVDVYECDQREEKGFLWELTRRDLRPTLLAQVAKTAHGDDSGEVIVRLSDSDFELRGSVAAVEPDDAEQTTLHQGETVCVVLSDGFKIARIWPFQSFYVPLTCPMCKKPQPALMPRNHDGVCHDCRPVIPR